ncbi:MAG: putative ureidoglycolate lyase [Devosia sp.]|nr:putative ureidoglycolate lyase [Devosia sp.]
MTRLHAVPIDAAALAPYATIIASSDGKPRAVAEVMGHDNAPGAHAFTILCPQPVSGALTIAALERHAHSTQSFVPIRASRWLIVVAPKTVNGDPDLDRALAFLAGPEDAICIGRDVWHAGLTVLDQPAQFGMIMWKTEAGDDGVLFQLPEAIEIAL